MSTTTHDAIPDVGTDRLAATEPTSVEDHGKNILFPLSLTPFERFQLHYEGSEYPATFYTESHFEGRFDRQALEQAFEFTVAKHPLLSAQVAPEGRRESWNPSTKTPQIVWQSDTDSPGPPVGRWIDLRQECGLRVWIREQPGQGDILHSQIHHACSDGLGGMRFWVDLMVEYSRRTGKVSLKREVPPPNSLRLKHRGTFRRPSQTTFWQKILNAYRFHVLTPTPLAAPAGASVREPSDSPVIATHVFDREETADFFSKVAANGHLTINDIAVTLLFRTVCDWQKRQGFSSDRQRIRILLPVDFRETEDKLLPAANRVGFSFPTRLVSECGDWDRLLSGLTEEIRSIRRTRVGMDFLDGLRLADNVIPGWLPSLLRSSGCMATTMLTNLGLSRRYEKIFPVDDGSLVFGDVRLHHLVVTPPISRSTRANFGMCVYSGRLVLSVQCDPQLFDNQSAADLMQVFVFAWRQWAENRMEASI